MCLLSVSPTLGKTGRSSDRRPWSAFVMIRGRNRAVAGNGGTLLIVTERSLLERELKDVRPGDVDGLEDDNLEDADERAVCSGSDEGIRVE